MIVRSPKVKGAPQKDAPDWPPKSPFQALLSSPSGRKKWHDTRARSDQRTPSPSPIRRSVLSPRNVPGASDSGSEGEAETDLEIGEDDGEEEAALKIQVRELRALRKLKELQAKKRKVLIADDQTRTTQTESQKHPIKEGIVKKERSKEHVSVPVSPPRKSHAPSAAVQKSPARVLLGLEKGIKASDVSLKRPNVAQSSLNKRLGSHNEPPKIKSFSERMAEGRTRDQERQDKEDRISRSRSSAFDLKSVNVRRPVDAASTRPKNKEEQSLSDAKETSGHQSARSAPRAVADVEERHDSSVKSDSSFDPHSSLHLSKRHMEHTDVTRILDEKEIYTIPRLLKEVKAPEYEPPDCETDYVVFGILASKSSPYDTKQTNKSSSTRDSDDENNRAVDPRRFMVLKLVDLEWELDCFLFGHAFREHWKLTPGTLLAILNPEIMPPKIKTDGGRFSLKLNSSEDQVLEIGVARDLGYCKSLKRDGATCTSWVNKRKTEYCDLHVNMMLDKTRAGRMEVNGISRGPRQTSGSNNRASAGSSSSTTRFSKPASSSSDAKRPKGGRRKDPETGEFYYAPSAPIHATPSARPTSSRGTSQDYANIGLSTRQIMDISELARPEQLRKRLESKERERATAIKLGALGNGIGAEYLRVSSDQPSALDRKQKTRQTSSAPGPSATTTGSEDDHDEEATLRTHDASALGLIADSATRCITTTTTSTTKRKRSETSQMGWGGAFKRGLIDGKHIMRSGASTGNRTAVPTAEKGQKTLRTMVAAASSAGQTREQMGAGDQIAGDDKTASGGSVLSPQLGRPVRKRARLDLGEKGIKEPGRESVGDYREAHSGRGLGVVCESGDDDGDDLDIVM